MQGPRQPSHSAHALAIPELHLPPAASSSSSSDDKPQHDHLPRHEREAAASRRRVKTRRRSRRRRRTPGDDVDDDVSKDGRSFARVLSSLRRHAAFVGPGIVASVAYIDPGNWATCLEAGSSYGYAHLFMVLFAGLVALLFQLLSCRLGTVSGVDLATHCRYALYDRPTHKRFWRWACLYPLYFLSESCIIFTDLAELLGSAIAINLMIPAIPLWGAVMLTSLDVFLILLLFNSYPSRMVSSSMRAFEVLISLLVVAVLGSFVALLAKVNPDWPKVFLGYVPSSRIIDAGALYIAVGILGATAMPHALFLGAKMGTMRRLKSQEYDSTIAPPGPAAAAAAEGTEYDVIGATAAGAAAARKGAAAANTTTTSPSFLRRLTMPCANKSAAPTRDDDDDQPRRAPSGSSPSIHMPQPVALDLRDLQRMTTSRRAPNGGGGGSAAAAAAAAIEEEGEEREEEEKESADDKLTKAMRQEDEDALVRPSLACVRAHLGHAMADITGCLLGFAILINSSILILAATVFYYRDGGQVAGDLFDTYDLVRDELGAAFAYLFAVALLAAGQSASLTVTLSGQIVSEGMIRWRTTPWKRRLVTRTIGIVPSVAAAAAVGREGIDKLLVGSQVALSIVLPFVVLPLLVFTASPRIMSVPHDDDALTSIAALESAPRSGVAAPLLPPVLSLKPLVHSFQSAARVLNPLRRRTRHPGFASFANPVIVTYVGGALFMLVNMANVFAIYQLASGAAG